MPYFYPTIGWLDAAGNVLPDAPAGYNAADFFEDRCAWLYAPHDRSQDVFAAAEAAYRGQDVDGIGLQVTVWDEGRGHITQALGALTHKPQGERPMPGFDNDWRCTHDNTKGCPAGGCETECARAKGWVGRLLPTPAPAEQPAPASP